jgi:hypothetical protein
MLRAIGTVVDWLDACKHRSRSSRPFDLPAPLPCSLEMPQRSPTRCRFANHRRSYDGKRLTHSRQDRASRSVISAGVGQEMGRPRQVQRAAAPQTVCPFAERRRLTLDASAMCRRQPNRMPFDGNALERPSSAHGWEYEPADFYAKLRYCPPRSR